VPAPAPPAPESNPQEDLELLKNDLVQESPNDLDDLKKSAPSDEKKSLLDLIEEEDPKKEEVEEVIEAATFTKHLPITEKAHYENVLKSNKETIGSLRKQLVAALEENAALKIELEKSNKTEE